MTQREVALKGIAVGDIFHGRPAGRASCLCPALQVGEKTIFARRITTQSVHEFDRSTGVENVDGNPIVIDSVAQPPPDIRDILLGLDRKYREAEYRRAEDPQWQLPEAAAKLTKDEIRALLSIGKIHESNFI